MSDYDLTLAQLCAKYDVEAGPDFLRMGDRREPVPSWEAVACFSNGDSLNRMHNLMAACSVADGIEDATTYAVQYELAPEKGADEYAKAKAAERLAEAVIGGDLLGFFVSAGD